MPKRLTLRATLNAFALTLFALLSLAPRPASAWNGTGHMVVAQLAWRSLTPAAKARVTDILTHSPAYADWIAHMPASYPDRALYAFMKAATWPDDIRRTPADRPIWHYVDVPIVINSPGYVPSPSSLVVVVPNAETELANQAYILGLSTATPADQAVALCWVEHLMGDIHQPLHCVSLYTSIFTNGDKGGNSIKLAPSTPDIPAVGGVAAFGAPIDPGATYAPRKPNNLHALWDDLLGTDTRPASIDRIASVLQTPAYARAAFPQIVSHPDLNAWILEGSALARQSVYLNGTLPQTLSPGSAASGSDATTQATLPAGYIPASQSIAFQQVALAGYRLADTLNATLKP